tara:strand:- start:2751 stop:4334 length:1584 start_codon:yes stop_codon:yes gene_type:complete
MIASGNLKTSNPLFDLIIRILGETNTMYKITISYVLIFLISSLIKISNRWSNLIVSAKIGTHLANKSYSTIFQKYDKVTRKFSTSFLTNTITAETTITTGVINAYLELITSIFLIASVTGGVFIIDSGMTIILISIIIMFYILTSRAIRIRLSSYGKLAAKNRDKELGIIKTTFDSYREIYIYEMDRIYKNNFKSTDISMRLSNAYSKFISALPGLILESFGFIIIIIIGWYLYATNTDRSFILAELGAVALASQKLLPLFQRIFSTWATIRNNIAAVSKLTTLLDYSKDKNINIAEESIPKSFKFEELCVSNMSFKYDNKIIFENCSFNIKKGESVGLIGATGTGKSTLIDILLQIINPDSGKIEYKFFHNNSYTSELLWRKSIAIVSQKPTIIKDSIANNIYFGLNNQTLDMKQIKRSAEICCLAEFIESLPNGYRTMIGDGSQIKLSGGQKQRIAIARALCSGREIIIMDEPTSSLDYNTEKSIMDNFALLCKDKTIIIATHREVPLKICSRILEIKDFNINQK